MTSKATLRENELLDRIQHLEENRLKFLDALESAAASGDFRQSPSDFVGSTAVLRDTAQRIMALAPFKTTALWHVNETTGDFELGWCEPEGFQEFMLQEFEQLTLEGIVALALNGERPVTAAGSVPEARHVVQVLTTKSRVRGILMAHFEGYAGLPDGTMSLLNIICQSAAASLEGLELYRLLRLKNEALEQEVQARREAQARLELLSQGFLSSLEGMLVIDVSGRILEANPAVQILTKRTPEELVGTYAHSLLARIGARRHFRTIIREIAVHGRFKGEISGLDKDHGPFFMWLSVNAVRDETGRITRYVAVLHSAAGQEELETALMNAELKYREIFEHSPIAIFRTTQDGRFLDVNPAYARLLGYASPEEIVHGVSDIAGQLYVHPKQRENYVKALLTEGAVKDYEVMLRRKDGGEILVVMDTRAVKDAEGRTISLNGFMRDITAVRRAEEEKQRLQKQLHQAQKLQSVGRLAGGVAHDFNNMLGVIIGQTQLALMRVNVENPLQKRLLEIEKAAQRSADLVRQLLAFARKQTVVPRLLNLNETISGMLQMLERMVGENVTLIWSPGERLWPVKIDPSQVDQILINLVVNAQDAISGLGRVSIATDNIVLPEKLFSKQEDILPGEYVLLRVQDTGHGMDRETLDQIFEPFFTTKDIGQGTGLGLATVYGIVKQNNGVITVSSVPEEGTTFNIYLPRLGTLVEESLAVSKDHSVLGGSATVLVVEDEQALLDFTRESLEELGYSVLAAHSPWEALRLVQGHSEHIDLLITDVVMPEMNGRDLALRIQALEPGIKCLFMSGYTREVIAQHGVLDKGLNFLQKPFTLSELAQQVRQVLETGGAGRPATNSILDE